MTNVNELKEALKMTLEEDGKLNQVRAMIRSCIFNAIETDDKPKPKLSDENLIINELIREYLKYNNYLHSASTFIAESGQPVEPPFDRYFISKELNVRSILLICR
jgi:lisH domain-containing protein FOPNL